MTWDEFNKNWDCIAAMYGGNGLYVQPPQQNAQQSSTQPPLQTFPQSMYVKAPPKTDTAKWDDIEVGDRLVCSNDTTVFTVHAKNADEVKFEYVLQGVLKRLTVSEETFNAWTWHYYNEGQQDDCSIPQAAAPKPVKAAQPEACRYAVPQLAPNGQYVQDSRDSDGAYLARLEEARRSVKRSVREWPICNYGGTVELVHIRGETMFRCRECTSKV